ncbi:DUF3833 domain-containing protein [Photobacterium sp. SDRW27]|uniref:DUF3833 domain-containing protein n=1 Tax=Photobacterium obscurum TaxID=2829490 RepID=UPI002244E421|nr:DUF3833 domain-containing protein [Photobacterium obscurum]MCW8329362.1 DUF3833 domain-containing protein [Photobacterium obscurum]
MLFRRIKQLVFLTVITLLMGCSTSIDEYRAAGPEFNLFEYFEGETLAWGMLQDRSGKQIRRLEVTIFGRVKGNILTLEEDFTFDDGEKQQRTWVITRTMDGSYIGRADDVVGEATGKAIGNALNWQYVLRVPVDETTYDISFDDWMFRQDKERMFNIAKMKKWGFTVGTLTLFFEKQ